MSCDKCCHNPCDRTTACGEGVYYKLVNGRIVRMVELSERLKEVVNRAVIKALFWSVK